MDQDKKDAYGSKVIQDKVPTHFKLIQLNTFGETLIF